MARLLSRRALLARSAGLAAVLPVLGCSPGKTSAVACAPVGRFTPANLGLNYPWLDNDKYKLYSDQQRRSDFVDDCTDIYSMHCYRSRPDELFDFTSLTGKPKWCTELGSYNYSDPTGDGHNGVAANGELYYEAKNLAVVQTLSTVLLDQGFELVMPWGLTSNAGMVIHRPDGGHDVKALPRWMAEQLGCLPR